MRNQVARRAGPRLGGMQFFQTLSLRGCVSLVLVSDAGFHVSLLRTMEN